MAVLRRRAGEESPSLGLPLIYLGRALTRGGRGAEGEAPLRRAAELLARSLGDDHYRVAMSRVALGECLLELGRRVEAEPWLESGHAGLRRTLGDDHRLTRQAAGLVERLAPVPPPRAAGSADPERIL